MKTVLYVEDNEFNRKIVRHLLGRTSYRLIEAVDGEAGVTTAREAVPDLIIMDIQLPKLSGLEATRQLRADPVTAPIPDHRHHLVRAGRRRGEGAGGGGRRLPGEALQPARAAPDDPAARPGELTSRSLP